MEGAVAEVGGEEADGRVEFDAEVAAEGGGVQVAGGRVGAERKRGRQPEAVHGFDRDRVIRAAEIEIRRLRFAEHLVASRVHGDHAAPVH